MKLYIKHMVSLRCKMTVQDVLRKLGIRCLNVELGMVEIADPLTDRQCELLRKSLLASGLELLDSRKNILVERIKGVIIEMIHYAEELPKINYSDYISRKLDYDYTYLSNVFSEVKGMTIREFIILHKIERVKQLLFYEEMNLTEISFQLQYSSVAHLSNQFKKVTGISPSFYKRLKEKRLASLENV